VISGHGIFALSAPPPWQWPKPSLAVASPSDGHPGMDQRNDRCRGDLPAVGPISPRSKAQRRTADRGRAAERVVVTAHCPLSIFD
jgi:hypothetical protein